MSETVNIKIISKENIHYPILIGDNLLSDIEYYLKTYVKADKYFIVTNKTVHKIYKKYLNIKNSKVLILNDGEKYKNINTYSKIIEEATKYQLNRTDAFVAFGGGVIGDMVGFCASTYMRGIKFVQIPTTLLAQVDSSVGGKVAVNTSRGKNLLGNFYQPKLVLTDISTLNSLDIRNLKTGLAEVIKYAFIQNSINSFDKTNLFFNFLKENKQKIYSLDKTTLTEIIKTCCCLKRDVVIKDEKELGLRAILNYGHTYGHVVENLTGYKIFTHGEAIVYGMKFALNLSYNLGLISNDYLNDSLSLINDYNLINKKLPKFKFNDVIKTMQIDKKVEHNKLRFVLNNEDYMVSIINDIDINDIKNVFKITNI